MKEAAELVEVLLELIALQDQVVKAFLLELP
jgi:hypothetical protein